MPHEQPANPSMTNKKIVVTGAHSYLGQKLLQHLIEFGGFEIAAFITPWANEKELVENARIAYHKVDLREPISDADALTVREADRILHFAWVRGKDQDFVLSENRRMLETLKKHVSSPDTLVFISSVSASPETLSTYGKSKYIVANELREYGAIVLVTGLIVDREPKGPYKLLVNVVKTFPFSVRFTKNSVRVYPIRTDDFLNAIVTVLNEPVESGSYRVYPSNAADINDFLKELENKHRRSRLPFPVSYKLSIGTLKLLRRAGILPATLGEKLLTFLYKDEGYLAGHETLPGTEAIDRPLGEMI
jgi:nucleoside-diphosphate-sugar epimerase